MPPPSVIDPILFVIYVNDLPDRLSTGSLLYADDVKFIVPPKPPWYSPKLPKLQRQLVHRLGAGPQPHQKRAPPHFATYTLPSHDPPNTQTIPIVSTTKDLGICLNTRRSSEDNVVSADNKTCRMLFYLKQSSAALTPSIFLPCTKRLSGHILNILFKQPIPFYPATQRR